MADICRKCEKGENDCMCDNTADYKTVEKIEEEIEWITDETTTAEYISMAWHAFDVMETFDPMTEAAKARKRRVQFKCIKIIEKCITEVYDDLFDKTETEEN